MLKSKIAMALAVAMVMAALYGCSSSDSGLKNDLNTAEETIDELQDKLDALAVALGITDGRDPTAADVAAAATDATLEELQELATALDLTVPADATRQQVVDAINEALGEAAGPVNAFAAADKAKTYAGKAMDAVMDASEKSVLLLTMPVMGNSQKAVDNAQAVLDAQMARDTALSTADMELANAEGQVDEQAADDDYLNNALVAAVEIAEDAIMDAKAKAQGDMMTAAVKLVENPDDETPAPDPLKTPADAGYKVATDIAMALVPTSDADGSATRHRHGAVLPVAPNIDLHPADDHQGHTWEEIVVAQGGTVVEKRLGTSDTGTEPRMASSIAGMTLTTAQAAGDIDDGTQVTATYMGIAGTAFCQGETCTSENVTGDDGTLVSGVQKLVGDWYFTPDSLTDWYIRESATADYAKETLFVRFGHWLTANDDFTEFTVNTYAKQDADITERGDLTTVNVAPETTLLDEEATYSGTAVGMAIHKTGTIGDESRHSGRFQAVVTLTAEFDATAPMLGGTVNQFTVPLDEDGNAMMDEDGNAMDNMYAVDPGWTVELKKRAFDDDFADGITITTAQDGVWSASAYGEANERPTGIFGNFNAHFPDGHVAGAYATRK